MRQRLLATLLHYANARPPVTGRTEFYSLKERLLNRYANQLHYDIQEIRKECWGDYWWLDQYIPCGPTCKRCGGTGIFDIRWVTLEKWEWCGWIFHRPIGDTRKPPEIGSVRIFGRIEHPDYGRLSNEALLWLYLLCGEWRLLWRSLRGWCCYGRYWYPLTILQRLVMPTAMFFRWQRCFCGKRYPTWGSGWQCCRKCRATPVEIPF